MRDQVVGVSVSVIFLAGAGQAQDIGYQKFGISYGQILADGLEEQIHVLQLEGAAELQFDDLLISTDLRPQTIWADGEKLDGFWGTAHVGYYLDPDTIVSAGLFHSNFDSNTATSYFVGAEHRVGDYTFGAGFGFGEQSDQTFSLFGSYAFNDALDLLVGVSASDGPAGTSTFLAMDYDEDRLDFFASANLVEDDAVYLMQGRFEISDRVRVNGTFADFGPVRSYSAGAGYKLRENVWLDAGIGRTTGDFGDSFETIKIGVTFEQGRQTLVFDRIQSSQLDLLDITSFAF